MKLFGKYLIEKGVVTEEAIVRALIEQTKRLPSIAEVVFDKKFLSSDQVFQIFQIQTQDQLTFVEAAKKLNLWSDSLQSQVQEIITSIRTPLGELLVQLGAAPLGAITKSLDEFLSVANLPDVQAQTQSPKQMQTQAASVVRPETITAVNQTQVPSFSPFCDLFTTDLQFVLLSVFQVDLETSISNGIFSKARAEIHRLKGAARLVMANQMEHLLSSMEKLIEELGQRNLAQIETELRTRIEASGVEFVGLLWEIQERLAAVATEAEVVGDKKIERRIRDVCAVLEVIQFDLGFLDNTGKA